MCIQGILQSPVGCSLNHACPARERPLRLTRGQGRGASRTIVSRWGSRGAVPGKTAGRANCGLTLSKRSPGRDCGSVPAPRALRAEPRPASGLLR